MEHLICKQELIEKLELLKLTIQSFDYSSLKNIIFFNLNSLYLYMANIEYCTKTGETIDHLLDEIEMFIPIGLTNSSLDLFFSASEAYETENIEELSQTFNCRCRLDFLNLIRMTKDAKGWHKILDSCEHLRRDKEFSATYFV